MRRLGLHGESATGLDAERLRSAYLAAVRRHHPDVNASPGSGAHTAELNEAYRVVRASLVGEPPASEAPPSEPRRTIADVAVIADDTIEVDAPMDLTFSLLFQAAHRAGDVTYFDRSALMLQVYVEFVDEPPCHVVFDLQGRAAHGTTEVFCTIESLDDRPPPPIDAVTRYVAQQLATAAAV